jgi:hypothetical protein
LAKKTEGQKSHDTVPLKLRCLALYRRNGSFAASIPKKATSRSKQILNSVGDFYQVIVEVRILVGFLFSKVHGKWPLGSQPIVSGSK